MIASKVATYTPQKVRSPFTFTRYSVPHTEHPERNDDTILLDRSRGLAAVFDGVGSGPGQVASRLAARVIRRNWLRLQAIPTFAVDTELDLEDTLRQLIEEAHTQVQQEGERLTMETTGAITSTLYPATTVVLALFSRRADTVHRHRMSYVHIGDSRIYLWRPTRGLQRLTEDDGFLSLKLQEGLITLEEAQCIDQATSYAELSDLEQYCFDNRNAITQAIGSRKPLVIHVGSIDLQSGDRILLCSDGIHDNLTDKELTVLLQSKGRTTVAKKIVQQAIDCSNSESPANMRAKSDDMSAVVVSYELFC